MTDPDERMLCVDVVTVSHQLSELMSRRLATYGVTLGQLPALLALYEADGLTQTELARRTGVEQPTMAVTLRRMERDGLIHRVADPSDQRRAHVHLTPRALAIRDDIQRQRADLDEIALRDIPDADRAALQALLARMSANLS